MAQIVTHGTLDYAELAALGVSYEELTIFSSNINPYGPPPAVVDAVQDAVDAETIARYPDRLSLDLRRALAKHHHISPGSILVGNGTADIMWLIATLFLRDRRVVILGPTFGEYENVATLVENEPIFVSHPGWQRLADGRYQQDDSTLADCQQALAAAEPDVVFICNPNNPTGHYLAPHEMEFLHEAAPDALWIVDEAYADFVEDSWSVIHWTERGSWLVLRSMTKDFALGGLRLGYAVGAPELVAMMQSAQPPWNVNVLAQLAGEAAMHSVEWRTDTLARLREHTAELREQLQAHGFDPLPTTANYFLLPVENATEVRDALLPDRLMVRDCTSFGLPQYIRIATQLPEQNKELIAALHRHVHSMEPAA